MPSQTKRGVSIWAISLVAVDCGLLAIKQGGTILCGDAAPRAAACEPRTLIAMSLRTRVWAAIAGFSFHRLLRNPV